MSMTRLMPADMRQSRVSWLKFVTFETIEDHLRVGWMVSMPNAPTHHHYYGIEMKWICKCKPANASHRLELSRK